MAAPGCQAATVALLRALAGAEPIETQGALVFVGRDTVWKLRKAIRLPFLDFSTLAERERTARRELDLNRPHAPGLYRDVVAVTRAGDGVELDGPGAPVDWVLRMAPVPAGDFLDAVAARGGLTPALLDALGDAIAAYHAALPPLAPDPVAALAEVIAGNRVAGLQAGLDRAAVDAVATAAGAALERDAARLRARAAAGFVRRCHGDLHLGNLCLWHGRPTAFDALEFDEALASIDTGYDLAFLLMDLEQRADAAAANRVLNRYVARSGDAGVVTALGLYQALRAMVRAHVEARGGHPGRAAAYLARAGAALRPPAAWLVAIGGLPGTGKSTLARALAPGLGPPPGALVLRSDEIRKRQWGVAPETRLPPDAYTAEASAAVFAELAAQAATALAAGHPVIADATFIDPAHRAMLRQAAGGAPFLGIWLTAPLAVLEARVAARRGDASDADLAVLHDAVAADPGAGDWREVAAGDGDAALAAIRMLL
jgi:aminoglycoside phosphotransferase family enzyme/predicted kinase